MISYERDRKNSKYNQKGKIISNYYEGKERVYLYERKTCVMSAAAIKARDSENGIKVNAPSPTPGTAIDVGAVTRELQKITVLQSKNEAATFLDVALFGICMASMNDYINKEDTRELISQALKDSATIATTIEGTKQQVFKSDSAEMNVDSIEKGGTPKTPGNPADKGKSN